MKKVLRQDNKIGINEFKRHVGAIVEQFKDDQKLNSEEFKAIHGKIDLLAVELGYVRKTHGEMLGQLLLDMEEVKSGLKKKVDYDEFIKLERRVVGLEMRLRK